MLSKEFINQIYINRQNIIEENISEEYHKRIKEIYSDDDEKENKKLGIISELYYKEGFKDGLEFFINYIRNI